jgi:hypothetical protein
LNNIARETVAYVLDGLDFGSFSPDHTIWRQHFFKEHSAITNLLRKGDERIEEWLLARNQPERHSILRVRS